MAARLAQLAQLAELAGGPPAPVMGYNPDDRWNTGNGYDPNNRYATLASDLPGLGYSAPQSQQQAPQQQRARVVMGSPMSTLSDLFGPRAINAYVPKQRSTNLEFAGPNAFGNLQKQDYNDMVKSMRGPSAWNSKGEEYTLINYGTAQQPKYFMDNINMDAIAAETAARDAKTREQVLNTMNHANSLMGGNAYMLDQTGMQTMNNPNFDRRTDLEKMQEKVRKLNEASGGEMYTVGPNGIVRNPNYTDPRTPRQAGGTESAAPAMGYNSNDLDAAYQQETARKIGRLSELMKMYSKPSSPMYSAPQQQTSIADLIAQYRGGGLQSLLGR